MDMWPCSMDMDMQHGHGHAAKALVMQHGSGNGHAWMPECQNADKKLSPASIIFR